MVEFHVLRCAECQTFQVLQVTKTAKWKCKLCGQKQSVIKVYGRGTGADCRRHVQKLNGLRGQLDQAAEEQHLVSAVSVTSFSGYSSSEDNCFRNRTQNASEEGTQSSRWSCFINDDNDGAAVEEGSCKGNSGAEDRVHVTTDWREYRASKQSLKRQKGGLQSFSDFRKGKYRKFQKGSAVPADEECCEEQDEYENTDDSYNPPVGGGENDAVHSWRRSSTTNADGEVRPPVSPSRRPRNTQMDSEVISTSVASFRKLGKGTSALGSANSEISNNQPGIAVKHGVKVFSAASERLGGKKNVDKKPRLNTISSKWGEFLEDDDESDCSGSDDGEDASERGMFVYPSLLNHSKPVSAPYLETVEHGDVLPVKSNHPLWHSVSQRPSTVLMKGQSVTASSSHLAFKLDQSTVLSHSSSQSSAVIFDLGFDIGVEDFDL